MKNFKKVLVVSNGSARALKEGLGIANREDCWVTAVKVLPRYDGDIDLIGVKDIENALSSNGRGEAIQLETMVKAEIQRVSTRVEYGDPSEKILEAADDENCDLIIMGAHKMNWLERLIKGSVLNKVLDNARCPVLVVRD